MIRFLPFIYLMYMFITLYMMSLFIILFIRNRKKLFFYPKSSRRYDLSVIIPAYNEEGAILATLNSILNSDYPIKKIIVVDDCSTDRTFDIVKNFSNTHKKIKVIKTPKNTGKAAGAINFGLKYTKTDLIAIVDSDSQPEKTAIRKMIGFFNDKKVGSVTCAVMARNRKKFIEKLQAIEYSVIAWTRKLLGFVDAIYVTPGPLAIYRKKVLDKIGNFDVKNMTEDIELTWRLAYYGYKRKMCLDAKVYSRVPSKFKVWFKQRQRWNIGGLQTINKYKSIFLRKGMLGVFILPFFVLSLLLGLTGLSIFIYLISSRIISTYLATNYSIYVDVPVITFEEFYVVPSVLNFFGIVLFAFGFLFTILGLIVMSQKNLIKQNFFNLIFYMIIYLTVYPTIMISSIYRIFKKDFKW